MGTGELTHKPIWLQLRGFYAGWWEYVDGLPHVGGEYRTRYEAALREYDALFLNIERG